MRLTPSSVVLCTDAIIAPSLVTTGKAFGTLMNRQFPGYMNYMGMVLEDPVHKPSPRCWLVWPGTILLLCASFSELAANYKTLWASLVSVLQPFIKRLRRVEVDEKDLIYDPVPPNEQVPWWLWTGGIVFASFLTCLVLGVQYGQNVGVSILAIIFAFLFSFIGTESAGRTNINPGMSIRAV
jgi:uncharacterized membrane protein YdcZ (DUF606 family)